MELSRFELLWIECALETELADRELIQAAKISDKIDDSQDRKDIEAIKAILEKVKREVNNEIRSKSI